MRIESPVGAGAKAGASTVDESEVAEAAGEMRAADWAALERLRARGDDLSQPRRTAVFFCRRNGDAHAAAELFDAIAAAATITGLHEHERSDEKLVLQGELYVHPDALEFLLEWGELWAAHTGLIFDGWECAVIAGAQARAFQVTASAADA